MVDIFDPANEFFSDDATAFERDAASVLASRPLPFGSLTRASRVLAVLPHFNCNQWLADALDSLVNQSIPLAGIAVIDDISDELPEEIVRRYPQATLFASTENTGPYRLSQTVIDATDYDGYLFQDADDYSLPHRLEALLETAERTGAELIGCQSYRLILDEAEVVPLTYPVNAGDAILNNPRQYAVLHPSSMVSRDLNQRIGGLATGLKYGGDTEFQHRAVHVARIANSPEFALFKRQHDTALTARQDTGLKSEARRSLKRIEIHRSRHNVELAMAGHAPNTAPISVAGPVALRYICGPRLRGIDGGEWPAP